MSQGFIERIGFEQHFKQNLAPHRSADVSFGPTAFDLHAPHA
jgi:hypothetical protein